MTENNQSQLQNNAVQEQHPGKQVDRPDEVIVNEQAQNLEVNPQEEDLENNENKEKGYAEGNKKDPDTEEVTATIKPNKEDKIAED
jgi:hypothetical protein